MIQHNTQHRPGQSSCTTTHMLEVQQIFLFNQNLHIIFGQERSKTKTFLADLRKLISEALHNPSHSHIVSFFVH